MNRIPGTTAVPLTFEQIPLPHAVMAMNDDQPMAKTLLAMFAFEDDARAFIDEYNRQSPQDLPPTNQVFCTVCGVRAPTATFEHAPGCQWAARYGR